MFRLSAPVSVQRRSLASTLAVLLMAAASFAPPIAMAQGSAMYSGFKVGSTGEATYTVQIELPRATNGMAPDLALNYNSRGGYGYAGYGWSIAGLSMIERCPKTFSTEGVAAPVNMDLNDAYCLDGQKLIVVSGSPTTTAEYRTEFENYQRIKSYNDGTTAGPSYFVAETKSGQTITYNARAYRTNASLWVRAWGATKVQDRFKNYYQVNYVTDHDTGEIYPDTIDYTFNENGPLTSSNMRVKFEYHPNNERDSFAVGGVSFKITKQLHRVGIYQSGAANPFNSYTLSYSNSSISQRALLTSILRCGLTPASCQIPLQFTYDQPSTASPTRFAGPGATFAGTSRDWGDLFGDGRKVFFSFNNTTGIHQASRINKDGTTSTWSWTVGVLGTTGGGGGGGGCNRPGCPLPQVAPSPTTSTATPTASDSLSTGATPLATSDTVTATNTVALASGGVTTNAVITQPAGTSGRLVTNLYGDGRAVLWFIQGSTHYVVKYESNGTFTKKSYAAFGNAGGGEEFIDIFNDGWPVYYTHDSAGQHRALRLKPDGTSQSWNWLGGQGIGDGGWKFANLFGNGHLVYWTRSGSTHYVQRFFSDGTTQKWSYAGHGVGSIGTDVGDFFGEGRDVYWTSSPGTHYFSRFTDTGSVSNYQIAGHGLGNGGWATVELFGDGRKMYWTRNDTTHYFTRFSHDGTSESWQGSGQGIGNTGYWSFVDVFGDGRKAYWTMHNTGQHFFTRFTPNGFVPTINWNVSGSSELGDGYRWVDMLGSGREQFFTLSGTSHAVTDFTAGTPDVLKTIGMGLPEDTVVLTYVSLPQAATTTYQRSSSQTYPLNNVTPPLAVVAGARFPSPEGKTFFTNTYYIYGDLLSEARRGSHGFAWSGAWEQASSIATRNYFYQSWPRTGLLYRSVTGTGLIDAYNILTDTYKYYSGWVNNGTLIPVPEGTVPPVYAGARYNLYESRSYTTRRDLNLVDTLPGKDVRRVLDVYGNPQSVTEYTLTGSGTQSGHSKLTVNTWSPADLPAWNLGKLQRTEVTLTQP